MPSYERLDNTGRGTGAPGPESGLAAGELESGASAADLRGRAASGAALLGARGALVMLIGVGVNLALARMLSPRDFGYVALGTSLLIVGQYLSNGGLGAALIRQPETPDRIELSAVAGVQLLASVLFVAVGGIIGAFA
jgi:lipopolysaccharide exporter